MCILIDANPKALLQIPVLFSGLGLEKNYLIRANELKVTNTNIDIKNYLLSYDLKNG